MPAVSSVMGGRGPAYFCKVGPSLELNSIKDLQKDYCYHPSSKWRGSAAKGRT